ncbi:hypothetical protein [Lysinibacillus odysseyi]|uniref:Uncharacterized protein n=2 Tax=Lysinibacillus odysseyi TaxID=202611 RepID=A0A0A3IWI4_9BACI|nr:hypothetical protein [Lysinibacillus odysseyi]KGR89154.1 hypothetical protein CD32_00605 [Lysinibacillus odysseyi 34hs-1 = NBRC 100172]
MVYLYPTGDTFIIYSDKNSLPKDMLINVIELDELPQGYGILKRNSNGEFYYDSGEPLPTEETVEDKLARMERQMEAQQQHSLTILDVNLTLYEEVLTLREEIAALKGTDNV